MNKNKRRTFYLKTAVVALISVPIGPAYSAPGLTVQIMGAGSVSCGTWTLARSQQSAGEEEDWVDGYITYAEDYEGGLTKRSLTLKTDANGIFAWLDNFCSASPTTNLHSATAALLRAVPFQMQQ